MVRLRSAATLLTVVVFASTVRAATVPGAQSWPPQLQLQMQVPFEPSAFPSAGRTCLIYELNLSNFESRPVTIDRADVLDADDEQTNSACYAHGKRVLAVADGIEGHRQLPS